MIDFDCLMNCTIQGISALSDKGKGLSRVFKQTPDKPLFWKCQATTVHTV